MDYRETLNLPKTEFPMKADLSRKEHNIQEFWENNNIYEKLRQKSLGGPKYILHDGPPYANGNVHLGTALNKILKDIIIKYKSMRGFDSPYVPGWDCHGMPIEHEVVKSLGKDKGKLTQLELRQKCRNYALKYIDVQREQFKQLGVFGDWDKPYLTMNYKYEAKIVEIFGELFKEGYIYKGLKPVRWCIQCKTALAEAEIEYAPHTSPSIYVKFPLIKTAQNLFGCSKLPTNILIWTTTPWTLPANEAVAVHPDFAYVMVKTSSEETLIMARDLLEKVMQKIGIKNYKILKVIKGKELEGMKYIHPLRNKECPLILADYVTLEEGTGCVHTAPGHGQEDYESGLKCNLPIFSPVNEKGDFTQEAKEWEGINVFAANKLIVEKLNRKGHLFYTEFISHSYPHCWRCKNPLIFRATEQWFLNMESNNLRQKVLDAINSVHWIPAWGKEKITNLVTTRPDWCLSRQRAWGVPIPVFYCKKCNEVLISSATIISLKNLVVNEGIDVWFKKEAQEILPPDIKCPKCGSPQFRKETDILDVWFDSGVSFAAVLETQKELTLPADLYLEATDQHRGWFQLSLLSAIATKGFAPYKSVLTHGLILDTKGKKMSKSMGNVIAPQELIKKYGADILRLWFASVNYTLDICLSEKVLQPLSETYRKIRNVSRYLLGNIYDFNYEKEKINYENLLEIDKWALYKLAKLVENVTQAYEKFEFHSVYRDLNNFCVVEMSSFYLDILKDRLYTAGSSSPERKAAQTVLFEILATLVKLIAPILSFTAEEIWQFIPLEKKELSVHLSSWVLKKEEYLNEKLEKRWAKLLKYREQVLSALEEARAKKMIGNPLEAKLKITASQADYAFLNQFFPDLPTIFIVSQIELFKGKELKIEVKRAKGEKCARCWNWCESVGKNSFHPTLCNRCVKVVKNVR